MSAKTEATIDDLYQVPDEVKAEIVDGEVVLMSPTGDAPGYARDAIMVSLWEYVRRTGQDRAVADNKGFLVDLPHRKSFSPDAAFYTGKPGGMKFFPGAPIFAAEVRSDNDYDPAPERAMARKRADCFTAGTLVVWDVDLLSPDVVRVYQANAPAAPTIYRRGEVATAERVVPGWSMPVDDLFAN